MQHEPFDGTCGWYVLPIISTKFSGKVSYRCFFGVYGHRGRAARETTDTRKKNVVKCEAMPGDAGSSQARDSAPEFVFGHARAYRRLLNSVP